MLKLAKCFARPRSLACSMPPECTFQLLGLTHDCLTLIHPMMLYIGNLPLKTSMAKFPNY